MRIRHVAALALVGWYLMLPPPPTDSSDSERAMMGNAKVLLGAPLSLWAVYDSYDTAIECRRARDKLKGQVNDYGDVDVFLKRSTGAEQMKYFAECIASDDPRLAK
jgi:hypothetical protein